MSSFCRVCTLELLRQQRETWGLQGVSDTPQSSSPFYTCELGGGLLSEALGGLGQSRPWELQNHIPPVPGFTYVSFFLNRVIVLT